MSAGSGPALVNSGLASIRGNPRWLPVAGALAALAMCLPWTTGLSGYYIAGWYAPGSCVTVYGYDGYASLECTSGYVSPGFYSAGVAAAPGYVTSMRLFVAVAVLLLYLARRRGDRRLTSAGMLVAAAGFLLNVGAQSGQLVFAAALTIALLATQPWSWPGRRQASAAMTSPATSRIRSSSSAP